jgi:hypothetical protein
MWLLLSLLVTLCSLSELHEKWQGWQLSVVLGTSTVPPPHPPTRLLETSEEMENLFLKMSNASKITGPVGLVSDCGGSSAWPKNGLH